MYYIYVLRCTDNSLYTGITNNLCKRLKEHYYKLDTAAKYTKARDVACLELVWQTESRSLALKREYAFKKLAKAKKEAVIQEPSMLADDAYQYMENYTLENCLTEQES